MGEDRCSGPRAKACPWDSAAWWQRSSSWPTISDIYGSWEMALSAYLWGADHFAVRESLMKYNTKTENAASHSEMVAPMNFQCQQHPIGFGNCFWITNEVSGPVKHPLVLASHMEATVSNSLICEGSLAGKEIWKLKKKNSEKRDPLASQRNEDTTEIWDINVNCFH